jgi:hypothetical protein
MLSDPVPAQKWISVSFRLGVFIFVTAALMGNVWQVWVGSALFILPTIIGFYSHKFRNVPWIWRIMPTGIPGLAFALIVASVTTSIVNGWFGSTPDLALWSFALLPIPMLGIAILAMIGREGNEGEIRWIKKAWLQVGLPNRWSLHAFGHHGASWSPGYLPVLGLYKEVSIHTSLYAQ